MKSLKKVSQLNILAHVLNCILLSKTSKALFPYIRWHRRIVEITDARIAQAIADMSGDMFFHLIEIRLAFSTFFMDKRVL